MLRDLKHNKFKPKENTFEKLANEHAHLRKRDLKGEQKEPKIKPSFEKKGKDEDHLRKWGSAPNNNQHLKATFFKIQNDKPKVALNIEASKEKSNIG